jgi:broad specificity phosphatase PhoE
LNPETSALRLVLVRHGETEWTEKGLLHGRLDSPLSPTGQRHIQMTATRLRGEHFDAFYSSPLGRAMQTAEIIGQEIGMQPVPLDGLREMDFGWTEGKPLQRFDPDGTGARFYRPMMRFMMAITAERPGRFANRLRATVRDLESWHPNGRVLAVTHWGAISMLTSVLIDGDLRDWRNKGPWAAGGISELHYTGTVWQAAYLNDQAHLNKKASVSQS